MHQPLRPQAPQCALRTARQRQVPGAARRPPSGATGVSESLHTLAPDPCRLRVPRGNLQSPTPHLQGGPECCPPRPEQARLTRPQPYPGVPGSPQPRHGSPPNHSDDHHQNQGAGWNVGTRSVSHSAPLSEPLTRDLKTAAGGPCRSAGSQPGQSVAHTAPPLPAPGLPAQQKQRPRAPGWRRRSPAAAAKSSAPRPAHAQRTRAVHLAAGKHRAACPPADSSSF